MTENLSPEKRYYRMLFLAVLVIWFFFPVISLFSIVCLWCYDEGGDGKDTFFIFWASLTYGLVSYTGKSIGTVDDTDIARYHIAYQVMSEIRSWGGFFALLALDGAGNVIFYLVNFLISRVFPDNAQVHILFWVTVTAFFTLCGAFNAFKLLNDPVPHRLVKWMILIFLLGVIPFFTVTEIIKQCASVAIFFYALVRKLSNRKNATFFLIVSLMVHISSFIILPIYLFFGSRLVKKSLLPIILICTVLSLFNANVILATLLSFMPGSGLASRAETYENYSNWSISLRHYGTFFFYCLIAGVLYYDYLRAKGSSLPDRWKEAKLMWFMVIFLSLMVLLVNKGNVHNFVRYIYGLFPFYIFSVIALLNTNIKIAERYGLVVISILFFTFSNIKLLLVQTVEDTRYANSYFDNSLTNIFTSDVMQFLNYRVK